jgi:hypothetical protein
MDSYDTFLLEESGWVIECESPFEIRHQDGSFATLNAAQIVLDYIRRQAEWGDE